MIDSEAQPVQLPFGPWQLFSTRVLVAERVPAQEQRNPEQESAQRPLSVSPRSSCLKSIGAQPSHYRRPEFSC